MHRFICRSHNSKDNSFFPNTAEEMLSIAEKLRAEMGVAWLRLPAYSYMEANVLGAIVKEADGGARVVEKAYGSADELPLPQFVGCEQVNIFLQAVRLAAEKGYTVLADINGPLSILDSLIPTAQVYKMLRKDAAYLAAVFDGLGELTIRSIQSGAKVISFSDPLATADLIGGKNLADHFVPLFKRFTESVAGSNTDHVMHICGKLSQDLVDMELLNVTEHPVPESASLDTAIIDMAGSDGQHMIGLSCVNNPSAWRKSLFELCWK